MDTLIHLNRRQFLCAAGTAAATMLLPKFSKAAGNRPVIGSGEHKYEVIHDWLTPPSSIKFGDTQGLTQDSYGNIYVGHTVHPDSTRWDAIVKFNSSGEYIGSWGERFRGGSHGLSCRTEGDQEFLYHCDTAHKHVVKTDLTGRVI